MTVNRSVPCSPYITHDELAACCEGVEPESGGGDPADTLLSRTLASEFLYYRTAMQYPGECTETIRPCYTCSPCTSEEGPPWQPIIDNGRIYNIRCTGDPCGCTDASFIEFADSPITSVDEVKIDGVVMPAADYRLYNDTLYRADGGIWPYCNELFLDDDQPNTWSVTYTFGHAPPEILKQAAIAMACHWQDMCGDGDSCNACRIPRNAVSMSRGNTSYQLLTPASMQAMTGNIMLVGIIEVDYAIQTLNPGGYRRMARVYD